MHVSELLSKKGADVVTIEPDALISSAIAHLDRHNIGALVVSSDGRAVQGILSERDIVRALHGSGATVLDDPVESIMSAGVHTCSPDDTVEHLMTMMTNERIRHVPVVSEAVLVGMMSIGDVVKNRMEALEQDRETLMEYINAR